MLLTTTTSSSSSSLPTFTSFEVNSKSDHNRNRRYYSLIWTIILLGFFELRLVYMPEGIRSSLLVVDTTSSSITKTPSSFSLSNNTTKSQKQQHCTSPEYHSTPFPLRGDAISQTNSSITCGLQNSHDPFSKYLREIVRNNWLVPNLTASCEAVVYGVALGGSFVQDVMDGAPSSSSGNDGICFFMLTYQKDMPDRHGQPMKFGQYWFLPIPQWVFPYQNPRRNAKVSCIYQKIKQKIKSI
jgi:hypothetical protein